MERSKKTSWRDEALRTERQKRAFAELDKNGTGEINIKEMRRALKRLHMPVRNQKEFQRLFSYIDTNGDGLISFAEFQQFCQQHVVELEEVFSRFDPQGSGTIASADLVPSLRAAGVEFDEEEARKLSARFEAAKNGVKGRIAFADWARGLLLLPVTRRISHGLTALYFTWVPLKSDLRALQTTPTRPLSEAQVSDALADLQDEFRRMQEHLYVSGRHAVLVVLQGVDTAGKDGAIKTLLAGLDASATGVVAFKAPTETEQEHDFLWRVHRGCPKRGSIVVFNRSHYEDVLVVRLQKLVSDETVQDRYQQINEWERYLTRNATIVIKVVLHISKEEQRSRLFRRQALHVWKLSPSDWPTHDRYDEYLSIYNDALSATSTDIAPWHVVPADTKWFRDLALLRVIVDQLRPHHAQWKRDIGGKARGMPPYARPFPESWEKPKAKL